MSIYPCLQCKDSNDSKKLEAEMAMLEVKSEDDSSSSLFPCEKFANPDQENPTLDRKSPGTVQVPNSSL